MSNATGRGVMDCGVSSCSTVSSCALLLGVEMQWPSITPRHGNSPPPLVLWALQMRRAYFLLCLDNILSERHGNGWSWHYITPDKVQ
jgi:hypothetical protein